MIRVKICIKHYVMCKLKMYIYKYTFYFTILCGLLFSKTSENGLLSHLRSRSNFASGFEGSFVCVFPKNNMTNKG